MAESASHKLGELIGDKYEMFIARYLRENINKMDFYVDYNHERPASPNGTIM